MAEKKSKEKQKEPEKVLKMYAGPSIRKYGLVSGTVYIDFPTNVEEAIKEYPEIKSLFILVDKDFAKNKEKFKTSGSKENLILKRILEKLGGK